MMQQITVTPQTNKRHTLTSEVRINPTRRKVQVQSPLNKPESYHQGKVVSRDAVIVIVDQLSASDVMRPD